MREWDFNLEPIAHALHPRSLGRHGSLGKAKVAGTSRQPLA